MAGRWRVGGIAGTYASAQVVHGSERKGGGEGERRGGEGERRGCGGERRG